MPICFATDLSLSQLDFNRLPFYCVWDVYCFDCSRFSSFFNQNLLPQNTQSIAFAQAAFILQDVCVQTYDLILSNQIGHEIRYHESKSLVFSGVSFKNFLELCVRLQT